MKKFLLFIFSLAMTGLVMAQTKTRPNPEPKTTTSKPVKPVASEPALKTLSDSASYAIGVAVSNFYKEQAEYLKKQGVDINNELVATALNDILSGKNSLLDDATANAVMNKLLLQIHTEKSKVAIDSGNAFLERNKKRPEVKTTPSGLQYEIITQGTGIKPTAEDTFVAHYRGSLLNGTEFDASYNRGEPLTLGVSQVIPGWTEGLQLMTVGSKYKFYIPYSLGYGIYGTPDGSIPGGSTLIFEVELLDVKKHQ